MSDRPTPAGDPGRARPPAGSRLPAAELATVGPHRDVQFNIYLGRRYRDMLTELVEHHELGERIANRRIVLQEAIEALYEARRDDDRAGVLRTHDDDFTIFNTRLTVQHRGLVDAMIQRHPFGRRASLRIIAEEAIAYLYSQRLGEGGEPMT